MTGRLSMSQRAFIDQTAKLRVIVEGLPGVFDNYFPLFNTNMGNKRNNFSLLSDIGDTMLCPLLRKNRNTHKVEVSDRDIFTHYSGLVGRALYKDEETFVSLEKRIHFIAGLAITASIPLSQLRVYDKLIDDSEEFLTIHHDTLIAMIKEDDQLITGDSFSNTYTKYFNYLWFNYDKNITFHDRFLLTATLEHM